MVIAAGFENTVSGVRPESRSFASELVPVFATSAIAAINIESTEKIRNLLVIAGMPPTNADTPSVLVKFFGSIESFRFPLIVLGKLVIGKEGFSEFWHRHLQTSPGEHHP